MKGYVIGIDTGGTFTDSVIVDDEGNITIGKALTNYKDFKEGVISSLRNASEKLGVPLEEVLRNAIFVGHGTTLGTNAVINRRFAKVGFLTTIGHEDAVLIMRAVGRTDGLNELEIRHQAVCRKPEPIVPRPLIKGIVERVDCFGEILVEMDEKQAEQAIDELIEDGVEAIAISLLWSFANPKHEIKLKEMIKRKYPHIYVAVSHEMVPLIREYARGMSVIIDASIGRLMEDYISSLNEELMKMGLRYPISIMQAYGGVTSSKTARPISTIGSGPAGGVIGSKYLGEVLGFENIVTTDVGGTSFDVSIIKDKEWFYARNPLVGRYRVAIPMIEITSIGAGGGTIAKIDPATGGLRVGPESAGSYPGPVCYDLGGEDPTVTDADLILGYLNPDYFYEGRMKLNKEKALKIMEEKIAKPLKMDVFEAAYTIYEIINSYMADNLRQTIVGKGYDPRDFVIFAYGGNGPMHVGSYAKELGVRKAYIPPQASVFSAFGIASSDVVRTYKYSEFHSMPASPDKINAIFERMEENAIEDMIKEGFKKEDVSIKRELDMKYGRQVHEVPIVIKNGKLTYEDMVRISEDWERKYESIYGKGSGYKEAGIQIVSFTVTATCKTVKPKIKRIEAQPVADASYALKSKRKVYFNHRFFDTAIYDYEKLGYGNVIEGPAIIEAPTTTVVIFPEQKVVMDEYNNIVFERL